ncbi:MAG: L-aspartate oxidase [Dehalococcoidia bacterium]|nr:L-aspartate oxidase [Dehalococcoidia bacterium]
MRTYDYVIIGSGIAGLYTALLAQRRGSVLILTKGSIDDCNTKHAQGGIAAAIGEGDTPDLHFWDTVVAGAGLSNRDAVRILVTEAADRIADLTELGVPFDTIDGEVALAKEAAHAVPRILHAGGDATGEHIEVTLGRRIRQSRIEVLEHFLATGIMVENDIARGVEALDTSTGSMEQFGGKHIVLATGGAGRLFKYTTNSEVATGDGVALAYRAGAEIMDMELFQFHPTAIRLPGVPPFLISEAVRGEGGLLRNVEGYRFMPDYSPEKELAPRDVVTRSILYEMQKTHSDRVFLDITHLAPRVITARFPHIYRFCVEHGLDITKGQIPVAPAAHYMMGGVKTDSWGETSIKGLFAVGETGCTGLHGANRLASNSLLEVLVFSKRAVEKDIDKTGEDGPGLGELSQCCVPSRDGSEVPLASSTALQALMWENVGIIRAGDTLEKAADTISSWEECLEEPADRSSYELNSLVLTGRLVAEAALIRKESRGAHFRTDYPETSPDWVKHVVLKRC